MKYLKFIEASIFIIAITLVITGTTNHSSATYFPTVEWRTSAPEQQGIDSEKLAKAFDFVKENDVNIHSLILIRNGYLVLEAYFYPNSKGIIHDVASVTKSITSILIGIAIDKGFIKSINQPVMDFFLGREIANFDARKEWLTIEHLLTMRTGFCRNFQDGERQLDEMRRTDDWVQFMLDQPMLVDPGTEYAYCTGGTHLLSAIITQATGMNELEFAQKYLFEPLGINDVIWPADPQGNNTGGFDLHLQSLDMAKIGYLLLNNGYWNGKQIVSKKWVEQSTEVHVTLDDGERYGYLWWSPDENPDLSEARGRGGQRIIFSNQKNVVVVFTGNGFEPGGIGKVLAPSLISDEPLPENPGRFKLLKNKIEAVVKTPVPKPVSDLPTIAQEIAGITCFFGQNPLGLISFSLSFENDAEAKLILTEDDHYEENLVGLDGVYRFSNNSALGTPEALKGSWISDHEFELIYNEFANNHLWNFRFRFEKDKVLVRCVENTGLFNTTFLATLKE